MIEFFYKLKCLKKIIPPIILIILFSKTVFAEEKTNFKQVVATGRSILLTDNIETSRKRALEDALYIAALRGGADVNGFSAITSNTIINDQSVIKATHKVIDFKILSEEQDKEYLSIKISAVVGNESSKFNCKTRPINLSLFQGSFKVDSNVPANMVRYVSLWQNKIYEILSNLPNVYVSNYKSTSLEQIFKSSINPAFDYKALTVGIPTIQSGNYSLVPKLDLKKINKNSFGNYLLRVSFDLYKGQNFRPEKPKSYDLIINYQLESKFQFLTNLSTLDLDKLNQDVSNHLLKSINSFLNEINCKPLEGKLTINKGKLQVDLGSKQGIKRKQIGLVKGINIQNSMLSNSSVIVHINDVFDNHSTVLPLNDNIKLANLKNLIVEFVE